MKKFAPTFFSVFVAFTMALGLLGQVVQPAQAVSTSIVISQVYGGGGANTGTPTYKKDYVELFNMGSAAVDISGWSLQYGSSSGQFGASSGQIFTFPSGTSIQPNKYLLIALGSAGTAGSDLPVTADFTTTNLSMSAASGKVALANISTGLGCGATATPCTLPDVRIIDSVSYGAANNGEGGTTVNNGTALINTQGSIRKNDGCLDSDNNNFDFTVVSAPIPRNSSTAAHYCSGPTNPSGTGAANPSSLFSGESTLLTVAVSAGTNPPSTNLSVTCDLSSIGGSTTQTFYDN